MFHCITIPHLQIKLSLSRSQEVFSPLIIQGLKVVLQFVCLEIVLQFLHLLINQEHKILKNEYKYNYLYGSYI